MRGSGGGVGTTVEVPAPIGELSGAAVVSTRPAELAGFTADAELACDSAAGGTVAFGPMGVVPRDTAGSSDKGTPESGETPSRAGGALRPEGRLAGSVAE